MKEGEEYRVELLKAIRRVTARKRYRCCGIEVYIKWEDYDESENSWEPIENLNQINAVPMLKELDKEIGGFPRQKKLIAEAIRLWNIWTDPGDDSESGKAATQPTDDNYRKTQGDNDIYEDPDIDTDHCPTGKSLASNVPESEVLSQFEVKKVEVQAKISSSSSKRRTRKIRIEKNAEEKIVTLKSFFNKNPPSGKTELSLSEPIVKETPKVPSPIRLMKPSYSVKSIEVPPGRSSLMKLLTSKNKKRESSSTKERSPKKDATEEIIEVVVQEILNRK